MQLLLWLGLSPSRVGCGFKGKNCGDNTIRQGKTLDCLGRGFNYLNSSSFGAKLLPSSAYFWLGRYRFSACEVWDGIKVDCIGCGQVLWKTKHFPKYRLVKLGAKAWWCFSRWRPADYDERFAPRLLRLCFAWLSGVNTKGHWVCCDIIEKFNLVHDWMKSKATVEDKLEYKDR